MVHWPGTGLSFKKGQIWVEAEQQGSSSREILEVSPSGPPSVRWQRPGGKGVGTWCDLRRFRQWVEKTSAEIRPPETAPTASAENPGVKAASDDQSAPSL
jgi:hypothetical protein